MRIEQGVSRVNARCSRGRRRGGGATVLMLALMAASLGATAHDPLDVIRAAKERDVQALKSLVEAGADVGILEADGTSALHWVSHWDDVEAIPLLVRAGADVNAQNDLGATPLWAATMNGSHAAVEKLLGAGADPNLALRRGETPVMTAARAGSSEVVELLLSHGADPNATGPRDQTALMWATAQAHSEVVKVLLDHGADFTLQSEVWTNFMAQGNPTHPEHSDWFEHGGNTALHFAARRGDLRSARYLVEAGADVNHPNAWGLTPLTLAAQANFPSLLIVGADRHDGRTLELVHLGGQERYPDRFLDEGIVRFLLEAGAEPDLGFDRFTALHAAIMHRDEKTVDLLLAHGADPNLPLGSWTPERRGSHHDFNFHRAWVGARPLWLAARFGTPGIVRSLLDHGAAPNLVHRGDHWSGGGVFANHLEETTTPLLAAVGLSRTGGPWHPPHREEEMREREVLEKVRMLVEAGADVRAVDGDGRTALDGARVLGFDTVSEFLGTVGAAEQEADIGGN